MRSGTLGQIAVNRTRSQEQQNSWSPYQISLYSDFRLLIPIMLLLSDCLCRFCLLVPAFVEDNRNLVFCTYLVIRMHIYCPLHVFKEMLVGDDAYLYAHFLCLCLQWNVGRGSSSLSKNKYIRNLKNYRMCWLLTVTCYLQWRFQICRKCKSLTIIFGWAGFTNSMYNHKIKVHHNLNTFHFISSKMNHFTSCHLHSRVPLCCGCRTEFSLTYYLWLWRHWTGDLFC